MRQAGFSTDYIKKLPRSRFHWTMMAIVMIIAIGPTGCGAHVYHVVERGETLYSIGWLYGYDFSTLVQWNQIGEPYTLQVGQRLRVSFLLNRLGTQSNNSVGHHKTHITETNVYSKGHKVKTDKRNVRQITVEKAGVESELKFTQKHEKVNWQQSVDGVKWFWPARQGKIINRFEPASPGIKGLDIEGSEGQAIYSASSGKVVYSGSGLPRYGKLIIVKHNDVFLSAYAHNKELLVREGDEVKSGQNIAIMGNTGVTDNTRAKLHFEIRRYGKPVDPLMFLPKPLPKRFN